MGTLKYAPLIDECPLSMECVVEHTLVLGSHSLFIGRVVQAYADKSATGERGKFDFNRCRLLGFSNGQYLSVSPSV